MSFNYLDKSGIEHLLSKLKSVFDTKQDKITTSNKLPYSLVSGTPSSLPANGGNADTVDNKHASDFAPSVHNHDDRYYTEIEIDNKLDKKQEVFGNSDDIIVETIENTNSYGTSKWSEAKLSDNIKSKINSIDDKQDTITVNNKLDYSLISGTPTIPTVPSSYAPTDAEKNVIVGVKKNGTALTVGSDRTVNVTVPTQASDIGAMASTVTHLSGDVPTTRKVNNKALSADITLTASDVGARASDWTPSKSDIGLGNVGNFKAVSTVANQGLTDTEKSNARANIGAGTSSFSGNYNDLTNKPTIPTVNNATLTIQKNGTNVTTFTANASSNATANIIVPTKVSELTNDSGYLTSHQSLSGYVPTTRTVNGKALSSNITLKTTDMNVAFLSTTISNTDTATFNNAKITSTAIIDIYTDNPNIHYKSRTQSGTSFTIKFTDIVVGSLKVTLRIEEV